MAEKLQHLLLFPDGGLCNRMRAIASAKRLCHRTGARCTIGWSWGDYQSIFNDNTQWVPIPLSHFTVPANFHLVRHRTAKQGGNADNRKVPVEDFPRVAVHSLYLFGSTDEPVRNLSHILPWFPRPHFRIREQVDAFRKNHLPQRIVGIHIRRTDHRKAIVHSPDVAFVEEADRAIQEGFELFLATDNAATMNMMKQRYGSKLHSAPKTSDRAERWPRRDFVLEDVLDDMTDLFLLVACDYVIGSAGSTYSEFAIALNGNARSHVIDVPLFAAEAALRSQPDITRHLT